MKRYVVIVVELEVPDDMTRVELTSAVRGSLDVGFEGVDLHETRPMTVLVVDVNAPGRWPT